MSKPLMPQYESLLTTPEISSAVTKHHIGESRYFADSIVYHSCRVHDALLVAQKTKEPFASFIERVGCFKERSAFEEIMRRTVETRNNPEARAQLMKEQERAFINDEEKMVVQQITLSLAKAMLPPETQPTQAEVDAFMAKSLTPHNKDDLTALTRIPETIGHTLEFFNEPEMAGFAEPFAPVIEAMNSTIEATTPYSQEAAATITKIEVNAEAHKAAIKAETAAFIEGFTVAPVATETMIADTAQGTN